jgi:C-terminal processing protease CtpA/Prc
MRHLYVATLCCAASLAVPAAGAETPAERRAVIERAAGLLETNYVYPDQGRSLARQIREEAQKGRWSDLDDQAFSATVTRRLREISGDGHFSLDYSARELPPDSKAAEAGFSAGEFERWYGVGVNHGFEEVRRLPGDVGYLNLTVFAPPALGADLAVAAMTLLAQSGALIVDLRRNGGGDGAMGLLIAGYLLDKPQEMSGTYDRPTDTLSRSSTPVWVPGRRFGSSKPVYLLISRETFSAAEAFAYDLQAAGRAIVVGEPSGGGAHPFVYRRVGAHFVLSLPEGRSINPITGKDWQGVGVTPDVRVPAAQALDEALRLARLKTAEARR